MCITTKFNYFCITTSYICIITSSYSSYITTSCSYRKIVYVTICNRSIIFSSYSSYKRSSISNSLPVSASWPTDLRAARVSLLSGIQPRPCEESTSP